MLRDAPRGADERLAVFRRFLAEWGRRHELAIAHAEPRLVHENGDGKHVLVLDDGFLWFDFEMIWRSRARVADHVSHEIIQYLWFLSKSVRDPRLRLLEETAAALPEDGPAARRLLLLPRRPAPRARPQPAQPRAPPELEVRRRATAARAARRRMSVPPALPPPRLLQDVNRDGGGNRLLLYEIEGRPALLKEYRARGAALREWTKAVGYWVLERKRGVTVRGRCALERELLALWRRQGFDVPAVLTHPLPPGFDPRAATWLEYCPGPTLQRFVRDAAEPLALREAEVARFAATLASAPGSRARGARDRAGDEARQPAARAALRRAPGARRLRERARARRGSVRGAGRRALRPGALAAARGAARASARSSAPCSSPATASRRC